MEERRERSEVNFEKVARLQKFLTTDQQPLYLQQCTDVDIEQWENAVAKKDEVSQQHRANMKNAGFLEQGVMVISVVGNVNASRELRIAGDECRR